MDESGLKLTRKILDYLKKDIMRIVILTNPNVNQEELAEEISKIGFVDEAIKLHDDVSRLLQEIKKQNEKTLLEEQILSERLNKETSTEIRR